MSPRPPAPRRPLRTFAGALLMLLLVANIPTASAASPDFYENLGYYDYSYISAPAHPDGSAVTSGNKLDTIRFENIQYYGKLKQIKGSSTSDFYKGFFTISANSAHIEVKFVCDGATIGYGRYDTFWDGSSACFVGFFRGLERDGHPSIGHCCYIRAHEASGD